MTKSALPANRERLYAFGKVYDFHRITSSTSLDNDTWESNTASDTKFQIFLHATSDNNSAEQTLNSWNSQAVKKRKLQSEGKAAEAKEVPIGSANYIVERKSVGQATRGALSAGANANDDHMVDCLEVVGSEKITYHAAPCNTGSIGIEISNKAHDTASTDRPDNNHSIQVPTAYAMGGNKYQAVQDEQYNALILLLRYLCIKHKIPRKFLGKDGKEMFKMWYANGTASEKKYVQDFSGILHHRNVTSKKSSKTCPGVLHRDRLFRGIIDEWWMPFAPDGKGRPYYSGPFLTLPNPLPTGSKDPLRKGFVHWNGSQKDSSTNKFIPNATCLHYNNCDIEKLANTKSEYELLMADKYFGMCETLKGGTFPIGKSKVWHGGIHFYPKNENLTIYAAASGTIVAARVVNNEKIAADAECGSQCFVLLRHYVYTRTNKDANNVDRIDYSATPQIIYSLYMHLDAIADPTKEDDKNPPWFNQWLTKKLPSVASLDKNSKGIVFNPDIEVFVGDVLGLAGNYVGSRCLHFEVFSNSTHELKMAPWNSPKLTIQDPKNSTVSEHDILCDSKVIDDFVKDTEGDGIDTVDLLKAAPKMRKAKAFHKSEWSLTTANALAPCLPNKALREKVWNRIKYLMWWSEAMQANTTLAQELGNEGKSGLVWHYHPIEFMQYINSIIESDNQNKGIDYRNINLNDDHFIIGFLDSAHKGTSLTATNKKTSIKPHKGLIGDQTNFSWENIACPECMASKTLPNSTKFSLALLLILQKIRSGSNIPIAISTSHLCSNHTGTSEATFHCKLANSQAELSHQKGIAIDFHPDEKKTHDNCKKLFDKARLVLTSEGKQHDTFSLFDYMPTGYDNVELIVHPASANKTLLAGKGTLTAEEIKAFSLHMGLISESHPIDILNPHFEITFQELTILNDLDSFDSGEWKWRLKLDGTEIFKLDRSVNTGDKIPINKKTEKNFKAGSSYSITIEADGTDEELTSNEAIGKLNIIYSKTNPPPLGKTITLTNPNKTFSLSLIIESLHARITSI